MLTLQIKLREMQLDDLHEVMQVERASYEFPWSEKVFIDSLNAGYHCILACSTEHGIVGYGILLMAADEAHVLNLCASLEHRNQGIAGQLLAHLLEVAATQNTREVFLEVRPSNQVAIHLYESRGFNQIGVRANYYDAGAGREDAWVYALSLPGFE